MPGDFDDEEAVTGIVCLACAGDFRRTVTTATTHRESVCRWCVRGAMSPKQEVAWRNRKKR